MSIALQGISKRYGELFVVRGVDLEVAAGELFVLLGSSGSGKSTLLRIVAGLTQPDVGRVLLHGRDVTSVSPRERGIGFVFQHYALFRHMTVADNVEFPLRVRRVPRAVRERRREELLELVGLSGFARRKPAQLSGGQQQRVALARALAHQPPVLLLDEPFGALDAKIRVELRHTIRRIQRELAVTTDFVTHDQEEAFALADRVAVLEAGRLLEQGEPLELYLRPRHDFVATFLGAANVLVGEAASRSVRLGPAELPLVPEAAVVPGTRVELLLRPEDVEVAARATVSAHLGTGTVEESVFAGSFERLRLRLPAIPGVRAVAPAPPFGAPFVWLDALRPQHESQRFPVAAGMEVAVGVRRVHVLAPAALRLLVWGPASPARESALALAQTLARHGGRVEVTPALGERGNLLPLATGPSAFDIALVGLDRPGAPPSEELPTQEADHLLFVRGAVRTPQRLLVCVAVGEPGKADVSFTERLAWRLGAAVTVLTVLSDEAASEPEHVRRFLEAASRAIGQRGVPVASRVRHGRVRREIRAELAAGHHDLLVVGAPLPEPGEGPRLTGLVADLLAEPLPCPVLVVRAPVEASPALAFRQRRMR